MRTWMRRPVKADEDTVGVKFEPQQLAGLFAAPKWLRDLGVSAWLTVGIALAVVATVWVLSLTNTIVAPLITASVIAAVASPLVRRLERRRVARGLGTVLLLVAFLLLAIAIALVILVGIRSQTDAIRSNLSSAKDDLVRWTTDLGVGHDAAASARDDVSKAVSGAVPALLEGLGEGIRRLSSLIVFLGLTFLSTFFLLKDGPQIRHWAEGHMRVPRHVAHGMNQRVLQSLRGYFVGVTAVAVFNGVVVAIGALILGVPLAGTIGLVTFLGAYVPYLGAWSAGIFSVLLALGGGGADVAVGMIVVQLLANGLLQQLIQPIAYGAALGIHPLAVLLVTIAGGSLFGAVGLILAAPMTAAATRIAADFAKDRSEAPAGPRVSHRPA
jgi:putative heme transporter